ncbi:PIN domain-containing protein [Pantanalinema sp. GBBB05]|uniref:PIN domain-containing protein n=1 Tax=Pantanalinema sp. GBBB05 TaxID=2604139 RepID=UPI001D8611B7|nr:type II toxin-antitoxin system VapC family toxin [Pantanalinema sp. GBBB05]
MSKVVLDASALLAYLCDEPGAEVVEELLTQGAYISALNWAEVLSKVIKLGEDPAVVATLLEEQGLFSQGLTIMPLTEVDALAIASIYALTKERNLGLGDRACLGLAQRLALPVLTMDPAWNNLNLDIDIRLI